MGAPADKNKKLPSILTSLIDGYLRYYADGLNHTAKAKRLDLNHFIEFLCSYFGTSKPEKIKLEQLDHSVIQHFVDESIAKGEAPATVARRLATIKHMCRTLADQMPGFVNPAKAVKTPKAQAIVPQSLTPSEIIEIRSKAERRIIEKQSFPRFRNEVLFEFLIDTGLRADEVRLLRIAQLDPQLEWVKNVRTKGRQFRNVYITTAVRPLLNDYLERRRLELLKVIPSLSKSFDRQLPLFISTYACRPDQPDSFLMGAKSIWRAINELSTDMPLHPHLLRHSYATDLLETSKDIRLVAQALGHSDVRVTMRYTERSDQDVAKALENSRTKSNDKK